MKARIIMAVTPLMAFVAAAAAFLVPIPASWKYSSPVFYVPLALTFAFMCFYVGAVTLFLLSLDVYKAELRRAYTIVCISVLLLAVGSAQLPIISAFNLWEWGWVKDGGVVLPFLLSGMVGYIGVRKLAKLVGVRSWLMQFVAGLAVVLGACVLVITLPHRASADKEIYFDITYAILTWSAAWYLIAAGILKRISRAVGAQYQSAMAWLFAAFVGLFLALAVAVIAGFFTNTAQNNWNMVIDSVGVLTSTCFLVAGYRFMKTKEY